MDSYKNYLKEVCQGLTKKLGLEEKGQRVELVFKDDQHDQIVYWAILDKDNIFVKKYKDIQDLINEYGGEQTQGR